MNYTFKTVKSTVFVDYSTGMIIELYYSMAQPYDSQAGWQMPKHSLDNLSTITADKDMIGG
jgi:hypothetical protein